MLFLVFSCHYSQFLSLVVPGRVELPTSTLSVQRSNQLSYRTSSTLSTFRLDSASFFSCLSLSILLQMVDLYIINKQVPVVQKTEPLKSLFLTMAVLHYSCRIASSYDIAPERRCSSRTFRYGYLVTTQPQLPVLPQDAPCGYVLQVPPAFMA